MKMEHSGCYFADRTGVTESKLDLIPAVTIPKEAIDEEVERLANLPAPANGRRVSRIANPLTGVGEGLAPGIDVSISVLRPSERTTPRKAGDPMLSAPGWAVHNHASLEEDVYQLTVQDSPLNIWMGSLLWQESLDQPIELLGAAQGFTTNRHA
jgi:gentisate 1,2-dioxygenase